jgi:hypothetical protein
MLKNKVNDKLRSFIRTDFLLEELRLTQIFLKMSLARNGMKCLEFGGIQ